MRRVKAELSLYFNDVKDVELLTQSLNLDVKNNQNLFKATELILDDVVEEEQ